MMIPPGSMASRRAAILVALIGWLGAMGAERAFCWALSSSSQNLPRRATIKVCQNKDCCRRYKGSFDLVQTIHNLLPPEEANEISVEATSCLSHCDKGPNLEIRTLDGANKETSMKTVNGVEDVTMAAVQLELALGRPTLPILVAAGRVLDKASKATSTMQEQEKMLNSVVTKLDITDQVSQSAAAAHAYAMRSKYWLEAGQDPSKAVSDATHCISLASATRDTRKVAYRALADAQEQQGNIKGAIEALQQWATDDPSYRTKINKELQLLAVQVNKS